MRRFRSGTLRISAVRAAADAAWLLGIVQSASQRVHTHLEIRLDGAFGGGSAKSLLQSIAQVYAACAHENPTAHVAVPLPCLGAQSSPALESSIFEPSSGPAEHLEPLAAGMPVYPVFPGEWNDIPTNAFPRAVIGGTFDRLHTAHKLLLTAGLAICSESLLVGLTCDAMIEKKTLSDIIQPFAARKQAVEDFCKACRPELPVSVVEITDPVGPAGSDAGLSVLLYSPDSAAGVPLVQQARAAGGLAPLLPLCIPLLPSLTAASGEKMSSTEERTRNLGVYQPVEKAPRKSRLQLPYVIGLTGPIACGKSTAASFLESQGALFIDCDKLGHQSYLPGEPAYAPLVARFGADILTAPEGPVDRAKLGPLVFGNAAALADLNAIVWPAIRTLAQQRLATASPGQLCVLDAAVLLQAGWTDLVDEVWTVFVPRPEARRRLMQRNNLSEAQASQRLAAQSSVREYLSQSDVWICSAWEVAQTQAQLRRALDGASSRALAQLRAHTAAAAAAGEASLAALCALHGIEAPVGALPSVEGPCTELEVRQCALALLHDRRPGDFGPRVLDVHAAFSLLDILHDGAKL